MLTVGFTGSIGHLHRVLDELQVRLFVKASWGAAQPPRSRTPKSRPPLPKPLPQPDLWLDYQPLTEGWASKERETGFLFKKVWGLGFVLARLRLFDAVRKFGDCSARCLGRNLAGWDLCLVIGLFGAYVTVTGFGLQCHRPGGFRVRLSPSQCLGIIKAGPQDCRKPQTPNPKP